MNRHRQRLLTDVKSFAEEAVRMLTRESYDQQNIRAIATALDQATAKANQLIGAMEQTT